MYHISKQIQKCISLLPMKYFSRNELMKPKSIYHCSVGWIYYTPFYLKLFILFLYVYTHYWKNTHIYKSSWHKIYLKNTHTKKKNNECTRSVFHTPKEWLFAWFEWNHRFDGDIHDVINLSFDLCVDFRWTVFLCTLCSNDVA